MSRAIFNLSVLGAIALTGCVVQIATPPGTSPRPGASTVIAASPGVRPSAMPSTRPTGPVPSPGPDACATIFKSLDSDSDLKLTEAEYVSGMSAIFEKQYPVDGSYSTCGRPAGGATIVTGFKITDADHDGVVSRQEFIDRCEAPPTTGLIREPYLSAPACDALFTQGDANRDGLWSVEELEKSWRPDYGGGYVPMPGQVYHLACSPMYQPPYSQWLELFDSNADGGLSEDEICTLLTGSKVVTSWPTPRPTPVTASPNPRPSPSSRFSFSGDWSPVPAGHSGVLAQPACAGYTRYLFTDNPTPNGSTWASLKVEEVNTPPRRFGPTTEEAIGGDTDAAGAFVFKGSVTHPGPVDAPITESLIYRLRYDPASKVLTGTRQVAGGGEEPITLARVIFEAKPGGCASPVPQ